MIEKDILVDNKTAQIFTEGPDIVVQFGEHPFKQFMRVKLTPQEFLDLSFEMEKVRHLASRMADEQRASRLRFQNFCFPTPHGPSHCR